MSKISIPQLTPAEESDLIDPVSVMPEVEANIPMPKSKKEAIPEMTSEQELKIRSTTIKELADINGEDITPSKEHQEQAQELAREMITNKKLKPEFSNYPNSPCCVGDAQDGIPRLHRSNNRFDTGGFHSTNYFN